MNLPALSLALMRGHWKLIATAGVILALSLYAWRLDGLRAGYKQERDDTRTEYGLFKDAVTARAAEAIAAQKAVNAAQEQEWKDKADAADESIDDLRDRLRTALLRPQAGGSTSGEASAAAQGDGPSVPESLPTAAGSAAGSVCVNPDMLAGLAAYAIQAHRWALSLDGPVDSK